jgi:hypothetical protein
MATDLQEFEKKLSRLVPVDLPASVRQRLLDATSRNQARMPSRLFGGFYHLFARAALFFALFGTLFFAALFMPAVSNAPRGGSMGVSIRADTNWAGSGFYSGSGSATTVGRNTILNISVCTNSEINRLLAGRSS